MSIATPSATLENFVYWTSDEVKAEKRWSLRKRYTEDDEEDIVVEAEDSELYPTEEQKNEQNIEVITIDDDDVDEGLSKEKGFKRPSVYVRLCEGLRNIHIRSVNYLMFLNIRNDRYCT